MSYSDLPTDEILDRPPLPPGCGFENGELVPLAREPETDDGERLAEILEDFGLAPAQIPNAAAALDELIEQLAIVRAAQALRAIVRRLDGTAPGAVLARAILADDEPARETAVRVGVSHTAILKGEGKVRARLAGGFPRSP